MLEKIIPKLNASMRQINESNFNNIIRLLQKAKQRYPALRSQVGRICDSLSLHFPVFELMDINKGYKSITAHDECLKKIKALSEETISRFDDRERNGVLTKLFNIAADMPELRQEAAATAIHVEFHSMNLDFLDKIEEEKLRRLCDVMGQRSEFKKAKNEWPRLTTEEKCAHLLKVAKLYARVFSSVSPADYVTTFNEPVSIENEENPGQTRKFITQGFACTIDEKTDIESLLKEYPGYISPGEGRIVAVNIHEDARALNDYEYAIGLVCHEQAHLDEDALMIRHQNNELMPSDPYTRFAGMMDRDFNPWRNDSLSKSDPLHMKFYRVSIRERHAFGIQEKLMSLRAGRPIPAEKDIFTRALSNDMMM